MLIILINSFYNVSIPISVEILWKLMASPAKIKDIIIIIWI